MDIAVPFNNAHLIPSVSGIYHFMSRQKESLYIGKSLNLSRRIKSHIAGSTNTRDVHKYFEYVECYFIDDALQMEIYETYMINIFKPKFNVDKVITYKTQRYNVDVNDAYKNERSNIQQRIDMALENFSL
ncbi:GIY-YIG nuclease family protein [Alicyclobacillus acidoterrestris]|uniref:GIY-YIG nuclease family protein n=1 Tax=Alicyclobacillus acidoterrestris TaxID=1450 RepID=UPI0038992595